MEGTCGTSCGNVYFHLLCIDIEGPFVCIYVVPVVPNPFWWNFSLAPPVVISQYSGTWLVIVALLVARARLTLSQNGAQASCIVWQTRSSDAIHVCIACGQQKKNSNLQHVFDR